MSVKLHQYSLCIMKKLKKKRKIQVPYVLDAEWEDPWKVGTRGGEAGDCEKVREHKLLRERANAMSNAMYVSVGFYVFLTAIFDILNTETIKCTYLPGTFRNRPEWPILLGLTTMYEGIGSFALHASSGGSDIGRRLDFSGIYFLVVLIMCNFVYTALSSILSFCLSRDRYTGNMDRVLSALFIVGFFSVVPFMWDYEKYLQPSDDFNESTKILGMIVAGMACVVFVDVGFLRLAHRVAINYVLVICSCIGFAVGALMKVPELALDGCDSWNQDADSWFQLHSVWHGAVALGILFLSQGKRSIGDADLMRCQAAWLKNMLAFFTFNWIPSIPLDPQRGGGERTDTKYDRTVSRTKATSTSQAAVTPTIELV